MAKIQSHTIILMGGFFAFAILLAPFMTIVPVWDGGWYTACLLNATEAHFQLRNFNCVGHTSFGYMLVLAAGQYIDFGNMILLHGTNLILWYLAVLSFYGTLRTLWSEKILRDEQALLSIALTFMPSISANLLHLNLDFGVLVFALPTIFFLTRTRFFYVAIVGSLLVFSKETGAALYLGILVALLVAAMKAQGLARCKNLKNIGFMLFPLGLYGARTLYRILRAPDLNLFYTEKGYSFQEKPVSQMLLDFNIFEPSFRTYLANVFILQFNWIFTSAIIIGIVIIAVKVGCNKVCGKISENTVSLQESKKDLWIEPNLFVALLLIGTLYLLTRHRPFNHVRYLLCAFPMFLFVFHSISIKSLIPQIRRSIIWFCIYLFAFSSFSTFDPISKYLTGTFNFGNHSLLNMSSAFFVPNEVHAADFNRDELVYNLEYTKMLDLTETIFSDIKLDGKLTIMGSVGSRFFWPGLVNNTSRRRTARRYDVFKPHYFEDVSEFSHVVDKPQKLYYIEFPNMLSNSQLALLMEWYDYRNTKEYILNGYKLRVHIFDYRNIQNRS